MFYPEKQKIFFMPSFSCPVLKCLLPKTQVCPTSVLGLQASLQRTWDATASSFQALVLAAVSSGNLLILTAANSAPCMHITAGLEFKLCWVSGILGRIAHAAWQ